MAIAWDPGVGWRGTRDQVTKGEIEAQLAALRREREPVPPEPGGQAG
jgi:hypothetical protein